MYGQYNGKLHSGTILEQYPITIIIGYWWAVVPPVNGYFTVIIFFTMTSSNWDIFRVTGLCEGNSPVTDEFPSQRLVTWRFDVFFAWTNGWVNNRDAGDLRCHRTHYDVTVVFQNNNKEETVPSQRFCNAQSFPLHADIRKWFRSRRTSFTIINRDYSGKQNEASIPSADNVTLPFKINFTIVKQFTR